MKIATWNVNSLPVRLPQVLDWVRERSPDILCLQETKVVDSRFPGGEFEKAGYHSLYRGQPTYNGVAILSRAPVFDPIRGFPGWEDPECRILGATVGDLRVINVYVPNGQELGTDKYRYKLLWLSHLARLLEDERTRHPRIVVLGDFNIAPDDRDAWDPALAGQIFLSPDERDALSALMNDHFDDAFRLIHPEEGHFSWWDYRQGMFRRNMGLRIDLVLTSRSLRKSLKDAGIDRLIRKNERPSDHAPVWIDLL
ncbi:MAG: exodeoxyribonuclease III [Nitrospiraceae bacterium]|nr:exodeoxyribonuclease III [Nitrospiraceae bacterium]